jgi:hypothetical protein
MLDLVGTTSARDAVGAKVTASASGVTQTRVQDGGYHRWSQHHARIHFGLATARQVDLVIDWPSGQRDVHRGVAADTLYRAIEGGALQSTGSGRQVEPGGVRCGRPSYDRDSQTGFYVWQACADGAWRARAVAGGRTIRYRGNLRADRDFSAVVPVDIESSDRVDASDPRNIVFDLTAVSRWEDGVNFAAPDAAAKCFTAWGTEGRVFVGADATPAPSSFDPESLAACGPSSP